MSALFQLHVPKNTIGTRHDLFVEDKGTPAPLDPFCTLSVWEKGKDTAAQFFFYSVEDICDLAAELHKLGNAFAEATTPDDAVVPIGEPDNTGFDGPATAPVDIEPIDHAKIAAILGSTYEPVRGDGMQQYLAGKGESAR